MSHHFDDPAERRLEQQTEPPYDPRQLDEPPPLTIDGVTLVAGERYVETCGPPAANGIYVVTEIGGGAPFDQGAELATPETIAADVAAWHQAYERANGVAPTHVTDDGVHFRNLATGKIEFLCEHGVVAHACDSLVVEGAPDVGRAGPAAGWKVPRRDRGTLALSLVGTVAFAALVLGGLFAFGGWVAS